MPLTRAAVAELVRGTVLAAVGSTPLVRLQRVTAGLPGEVWAKLEYANPGGSVKDRAGLWMVLDAESRGELRSGRTILDATSGKLLWEYPWTTEYDINSAQPIITGPNHVVISSGYGHGAALLEITAAGAKKVMVPAFVQRSALASDSK